LILAAAAYLAILTVVVAGLGLLYRGARERLDEALGQRLLAVATTATYLVDGDAMLAWSLDPEPDADLIWLQSRLQRLREENDLAEVTLCDPLGTVIASAAGRLDWGETNVYWNADRAAVTQATEGFAATTRLYRVGELYQKSAHAPVLDSFGELAGVITVEGSADFFDALATLRGGAIATIAVVVVVLGLLGWLLLRVQFSLERARATLLRQENLAVMGRLTAGIAHEIRNPLGIIRGAGQHLQTVLRDRGIDDEVAGFIPEEVDRLDRILASYLSFGTDRAGERETVDLTALLRRTLRFAAEEIAGAGVTVEIVEPLAEATVLGDRRRLQQVVLNLLLNARDAMPDGGTVHVALREDGGAWQLTVIDEGEGLPDAVGERIFEPFWTSKPQGSGLGLAVSRRIAREHGGELALANRTDGRGCTATLTLPAARDGGANASHEE
jgi:two-component system sensor histidine kinase HydH